MQNARRWGRLLLWLHLFICLVWWWLLHPHHDPPAWMLHVFLCSVLAVQFTWGFTVGLIVGPSRRRRRWLWWSLLTLFMPLWPLSFLLRALVATSGLLVALGYAAIAVIILASETYAGVLLGAKVHSQCNE